MTASAETVPINDVNQLAQLFMAWHKRQVAKVEHYLQVPEGQEIQIGQNPPFILEGNMMVAFKAAINLALNDLGTLPFAAETEPAEANPTPADTSAAT